MVEEKLLLVADDALSNIQVALDRPKLAWLLDNVFRIDRIVESIESI